MSANIGSVATITGNPQNMMIGSFSQIPYRAFSAALAPIAAAGLLLTVLVIGLVYRSEFGSGVRFEPVVREVRFHRALLWKSLATSAAMIVLFFAGWPVPKVAVVAGALLLLTRRVKPGRIYREIDWSLLVLFIGLFIVVAGIERTPTLGEPVRRRLSLSPGTYRTHGNIHRDSFEHRKQRPRRASVQRIRTSSAGRRRVRG